MYVRNRVDTSPTPVSWDVMCKHLFGFVAFMLFMFWVGENYPTYQPVGPKQYPYNDLYLERGGDPTKEPEPVVHYEIWGSFMGFVPTDESFNLNEIPD